MSKKIKPQKLSDIKFSKKGIVSPKKFAKMLKDLDKKREDIDNKREVDWENLNRTYITI
jgi:hypothetical protein